MSGAAPGLFGRRRVRPRAMTTDDLIFVLVGTVLAMLLGLTLLFWGAAKISGRLNSGHWPNLSFIDMAPIVVNAIQNPSDPASAFPAPASTQIPGPVEFYGIMLVLFLIPAALIIALLLAMFREGPLVPWAGRGLFWRQRRGQLGPHA